MLAASTVSWGTVLIYSLFKLSGAEPSTPLRFAALCGGNIVAAWFFLSEFAPTMLYESLPHHHID
jgi:hypothetical protein